MGDTQINEFNNAIHAGPDIRLFNPSTGGSTDMKSSHRQLGAGFADGLGCQNTNRLAGFHRSAMGQVPATDGPYFTYQLDDGGRP